MPDDQLLPLPELMEPRDVEVFCAEQAEAIRVLGRRVVGDIIEIGSRLIAVKSELDHGEWLPWLDREFAWTDETARKFMAVASAFGKSQRDWNLPIDAGALYLLAGPKIPEVAREKAVNLAEDGERITKAKAQELVAEARREAKEKQAALQDKIKDLNARISGLNEAIRDAAKLTNEEVKKATERLRDQVAKAQQQRDDAIESLKKIRETAQAEAPKAAVDGTKSFRSMCIIQGIESLHKELRIPAVDAVAVHFESCALTTELPATRLGPATRQAREIVAWLSDFIAASDGR